jgi:hypothetical protein
MPNDPLSCSGAVYIKYLILNFKDFSRSQIFFIGITRKKKLEKLKISMVYK